MDAAATFYEWPAASGKSTTVRSDLDWALSQFGPCAPEARDLLRVVFAAYVADRRASQPGQQLSRALTLTVHVERPAAWTSGVLEGVVDLLYWLTGDEWALRCVPATATVHSTSPAVLPFSAADDVSLLSGGLDSLCGALIRAKEPGSVFFLGHADTSTAVRRAQQRIEDRLRAGTPARPYSQYALRPFGKYRNHVPKTRSLLFMTMAVAAATGLGAGRVLVPENGFTSINPPLEPSRAGVLTTRSTHPWTFYALTGILNGLGLGHVQVMNPYSTLTKGALVALAMPGHTTADQLLASQTVSCAKINAGRPQGGNANTQCGLCIACLVRRAAFIAAGLPDLTPYTAETLSATGKARVRHIRRHDIAAWRTATTGGIPEHRILGAAVWPPGTDFDAVLTICKQGLEELSRVPI